MFVTEKRVDKIRHILRDGDSPSLARRRKLAVLSAVGLVDFAVISLYQVGVIRSLPDFRHPVFDSNSVNASRSAYDMGIPDGTTGTLMYSSLLMLAAIGGDRPTGRSRWFSVAQAAIATAGAAGALSYLFDMAFRQKKICPYCLVGAAVNLAMVPLATRELAEDFSEVGEASKNIKNRIRAIRPGRPVPFLGSSTVH